MRTIATSFIFLFACTGEETVDKAQIGNPPIADAGSGGSFSSDQPISLDGSSSSDPDGDEIIFNWSFSRVPDGSSLLDNAEAFLDNGTDTPQTRFFADTAGTYIVDLVVIDSNDLSSDIDSVVITVERGQLPIADAGTDLNIIEGDSATLSGASSADPLGRSLSYQWSISNAPSTSSGALFTDLSAASPTFTPDATGSYLLSLIVNNGISDSLPDSVVVNVASSNPLAPVADAGADILDGQDCTDIQLNGMASSDPNDDELDFLWTLQSKPVDSTVTTASISDAEDAQPTFYPDVAGEYILSLAVYDGSAWSIPDLVTVSVSERVANIAPMVIAGASLFLDGGSADCVLSGYNYNCDACGSLSVTIGTDAVISDADGDPMSSEWVVLSGDATISDPTYLETTVLLSGAAPSDLNVCDETTYEFELIVEDCPGDGSNDSVEFTVTCCGVEPVITQ